MTIDENKSFKDLRGLLTIKGDLKSNKSSRKSNTSKAVTKEENFKAKIPSQEVVELEAIIELQQKEIKYLNEVLERVSTQMDKEFSFKKIKCDSNRFFRSEVNFEGSDVKIEKKMTGKAAYDKYLESDDKLERVKRFDLN